MKNNILTMLQDRKGIKQLTLQNGVVIEAHKWEAGEGVVMVDAEGRLMPLNVGTFNLSNGKWLVVKEEGVIYSYSDKEIVEKKESAILSALKNRKL
ncbi:hypothetical protein N9528_01175 [Crocinitomicaceae bacterium]|nr:hypothetical protein [Crocinitomicaceae bacterium]